MALPAQESVINTQNVKINAIIMTIPREGATAPSLFLLTSPALQDI